MDLNILSQVQIVELSSILPFEWISPIDLVGRKTDDVNLVRHPLLVTPLQDGRYVLLEDSLLLHTLKQLNLKHLPVQVVGKGSLRVVVNRIGLVDIELDDITEICHQFPQQMRIASMNTDAIEEDHVCTVHFDFNNEQIVVHLKDSTSVGCPESLSTLIRSILPLGRYLPLWEETPQYHPLTRTTLFNGVMTLPPCSLEHICTAAESERLFPAGLMKVNTHCRIFNIDFPISVLADDNPLAEKTEFLRELIAFRGQTQRVSYFEGQACFLND